MYSGHLYSSLTDETSANSAEGLFIMDKREGEVCAQAAAAICSPSCKKARPLVNRSEVEGGIYFDLIKGRAEDCNIYWECRRNPAKLLANLPSDAKFNEADFKERKKTEIYLHDPAAVTM